jgi:TPR repeat protein
MAESKAELYEKACNLNDARACNSLGTMYQHAEGVILNYNKAITLSSKACNLGNAKACTNLGAMYILGYGVSIDKNKSQILFKKSCNLGESKESSKNNSTHLKAQ